MCPRGTRGLEEPWRGWPQPNPMVVRLASAGLWSFTFTSVTMGQESGESGNAQRGWIRGEEVSVVSWAGLAGWPG